jgi:hypothetical protein
MLKYDKHIQIHTGTTVAKPCPKIIGNSGIESEDRQEVALRRQGFIFACWKRNIKLQVLHKKLDAKILGADQLVRV